MKQNNTDMSLRHARRVTPGMNIQVQSVHGMYARLKSTCVCINLSTSAKRTNPMQMCRVHRLKDNAISLKNQRI